MEFYRLNNNPGKSRGTAHILPSHQKQTLCGNVKYTHTKNSAGGDRLTPIQTLQPIYTHRNPCKKCLKKFHNRFDDHLQLVTTRAGDTWHIHPQHTTESICGNISFGTNTDFSINQRNVKTHRFIGLHLTLYNSQRDDPNLQLCQHCKDKYHDAYPLSERGQDQQLDWKEELTARYRKNGIGSDTDG